MIEQDKPTLTILVGPPGSGKSTYAQQLEAFGDVRISQDDQGKQGHQDVFKRALEERASIVVDRMNFNKQQRQRYIEDAKKNGYRVICYVFYVPKSICYERCMARQDHPTIKTHENASQALSLFFGKFEFPSLDEGIDLIQEYNQNVGEKKVAVIFDLDGTLCNIDHRLHFVKGPGKKDWHGFFKNMIDDKPNLWCEDLLNKYVETTEIVLCSGRPDSWRDLTEEWLGKYDIKYNKLLMRPRNDSRDDSLIKKIIYKFEIECYNDVLFVVDDRKRVVSMWREEGLTVLACAEGDF